MTEFREVNNYPTIRKQLTFDTEDDFYVVHIMQRKKYNSSVKSNSRIIKSYYIRSMEYLNSHKEEIKQLCILFKARAYIYLETKSFKKVCLQAAQKILEYAENQAYSYAYRAYISACTSSFKIGGIKKWIIDIDTLDYNDLLDSLNIFINNTTKTNKCKPVEIVKIDTPNGCHLVTTPFDLRNFSTQFPGLQVKRHSPTILYSPKMTIN